mgnify:CR=1 FL=1
MNYDDDEAYEADRDRRVSAAIARKLETDKDYKPIIAHEPYFFLKHTPVDLFMAVCKHFVAGLKIAAKNNDAELHRRYWIVDDLEAFAGLYANKDRPALVSAADSQKMAKAFAPAVALLAKWAEGKPRYSDTVDFQTGYKTRTLAGELDYQFLWLYSRLRDKGHDPVAAVHPILFMPTRKADDGSSEYTFLSGKFQTLLYCCTIYKERHPASSEIDKLFEVEMKKPREERFFNLDDDEDDSIFSEGTDTGATERSRLKAYLQYRQAAYRLHTTKAGGCKSGFVYVRDELTKYLTDTKRAVLHKHYESANNDPLVSSVLGIRARDSWFDLLYDVLSIRWWISYRDYCVDSYEEAEKTYDNGYHDDSGWPYFDRDENIPEYDICLEVRRSFEAYLETLAALAFCIQSSVRDKLASTYDTYESHHGSFSVFEKRDRLRETIDALKETINTLELELRLYKNGRAILGPLDNMVDELAKRIDRHDKNASERFDLAQQEAEQLRSKQEESLALQEATNENVKMARTEINSKAKSHDVSLGFSFAIQETCFRFWMEDRKDPMLANGHKTFRSDSFAKRKRELIKFGISDDKAYSTLINRYIKRTGKKIVRKKRKRKAERKTENRPQEAEKHTRKTE